MGIRTTWQQERRAETRDRLLDAAFAVFSRGSYAATTINDILSEAEVGRTSFYKHFTDKLTVAEALFDDLMPDLSGAYATIADSRELDADAIAAWLETIISQYERNAGIMAVFAQVQAIEPNFGHAVGKAQRAIMARLGVRFGLFARAALAEDTHDKDYARATLLIDMIDHLCSTFAIRKAPINKREAVQFLAGILAPVLAADA